MIPNLLPPDPPKCDCSRKELRRRVIANGNVWVGFQCLHCGRCVQRMTSRDVPNIHKLPLWNDDLAKRWNDSLNAYWQQRANAYHAQQEKADRDFWILYEQHMRSPEWAELRRRVFARSKGLCEGCGERKAVQVHHLTYDRLGDEMLFDLAAVCMICHEKIHGRPIG